LNTQQEETKSRNENCTGRAAEIPASVHQRQKLSASVVASPATLHRYYLLCSLLFLPLLASAAEPDRLSLAGRWHFELDRANSGIEQKWFDRNLAGELKLPGSLPAQGIGDEVSTNTRWTGEIVDKTWFTSPEYAKYREPGNVKIPFWLQPDKYYSGVAWYQREIKVPESWSSKRVVLTLERPHWETRVWLDDQLLGTNDSLSTPHVYVLGSVRPGKHRLTIRVDNGLVVDVGVNSHSISDHTQGNWNGIVGEIALAATPKVWLEDLQVYPADAHGQFRVITTIGNTTGSSGQGKLSVVLEPGSGKKSEALAEMAIQWSTTGAVVECGCVLPEQRRSAWDEFSPTLHPIVVKLSTGDTKQLRYGSRQISTDGTQFQINGRKTFIRGTLECCIFPKTGHPPTDVESWRRIIRVAKSHGLNLIRFHSWCPPEAAFAAADELGFYYQVEIASWANSSTTLGDGKPVDAWLYREAERILRAYGNHPSFLLMPYGNEPGGAHYAEYLAGWVEHWKRTDPRRLYTSGSGWPELPQNQFHVTPDPRIQAWGQGLKSRINSQPPETTTDYGDYVKKRSVPVISHEIGQWCVYPNFAEIPKYTGYLKPKNFEIFRESLTEHHMAEQAHQFLLASGKLQTLCYKEEIESALRTRGMGGFELLDLHDFPGQGTALVGVLDPFWEEKGYVRPEEFRRFCNSTVPLARLTKRVFTSDETLRADIEAAHFGPAPFKRASVTWSLKGTDGKVATRGNLVSGRIPLGNGTSLGSISAPLTSLRAPAKYTLAVRITPAETHGPQAFFENDWDVWVYPAQVALPTNPEVVVVHALDPQTVAALNSGAKVLLNIPPDKVRGDRLGPVALGFSSIFWNTAWTGRQAPHTLGILCDPKNPALASFPTEYHSNWQWWYLVSHAGAMILDELPSELRPPVQVIDDWVTNRKLGLVFEARVGPGKLLVTSIDLDHGDNPVSRQMRYSLLTYMATPRFNPTVSVTAGQLNSLIKQQ
jgi:hypothetical protein